MKNFIIFLSILFLSPLPILAQVYISEVMPNTDDDANLEYIDIINTGCESIDITWYQIADKEKSYIFAIWSTLWMHETYRLGRPTSKIILNNTNEELSLRDTGATLIDDFVYVTSTKWESIIVPWITLEDCSSIDEEEGTGNIDEDEGGNENQDEEGDTSGSWNIDEEWNQDGNENQSEEGAGGGWGEDVDTGSWATDIWWSDDSDEQIGEENVQTSNLLGKSWSLEPQILLYSDTDGDNRIDMLEVLYDVYLTGSVDISQILLYSNTGWLYTERVNTETGHILEAEIEDNVLRLFIEPSHHEKDILIHNATTQSDIRLKSNGGYGVKSLSWAIIGDFLLTSSFDAYKEVYKKSTYESLGDSTLDESSGSNTWTILVSFPEIIPTIQNYTNTTLSGNTFICRETPCRLNLNFESIFDSVHLTSSYSCQIVYNGNIEDKCNPSQWNPTSAWGFEVRIVHKATGQYRTQYFPIDWNIISTQVTTVPTVYDRSAPVPRITLNGTLTKKQIQRDSNHIYCYTNTCSLNLDASETYDPDGSAMTYSWSLSGKIFATKKNPTTQEFWIGEHIVEFTATDNSGKFSREIFRVSVLWDSSVSYDREIEIASDASNNRSKKKQKMNFFSPPELIVEKSSDGFSKKDNWYRCVTTSASCSVNFSLTWVTQWVYYSFSYSHDPTSLWSSNPRSKVFQPGEYILKISAHYEKEGIPIWQQSIPIEIIRIKKKKTVKKTTSKVLSTQKPSTNLEIIPSAYADNNAWWSTDSTWILSTLFFSLILNVFFLRKRFSNNV